MQIVAQKNGTTITLPGGASIAVGKNPVDVPKIFESQVRAAAAYSAGWRIVEEAKKKDAHPADAPATGTKGKE